MYIRKALMQDIEYIEEIYTAAKKFMRENGNKNQWSDPKYLDYDMIREDILSQNLYVCIKNDEILGVFLYFIGDDPMYSYIEAGQWKNEDRYGVVHKIATKRGTKGIGKLCLDWAFSDCKNLRIDTHKNNIPMQNLLKKMRF